MQELFEVEILLWPILLRCFVAILCGVVIGLERAWRAKPAGVRTHALISLGSCLFMGVSLLIAEESRRLGYTTPDPARIAAQVVTGIGFLGAGVIIRNSGFVRGMTSAATIWAMAAIGLAAGAGMLLTAVAVTFSIVIVLRLFDYMEKHLRIKRFYMMSLDVIVKKEGRVPDIRSTLRQMNVTLSQERLNHVIGEIHYQANLLFYGDLEDRIEKSLRKIKGVRDVVILVPGEFGGS